MLKPLLMLTRILASLPFSSAFSANLPKRDFHQFKSVPVLRRIKHLSLTKVDDVPRRSRVCRRQQFNAIEIWMHEFFASLSFLSSSSHSSRVRRNPS